MTNSLWSRKRVLEASLLLTMTAMFPTITACTKPPSIMMTDVYSRSSVVKQKALHGWGRGTIVVVRTHAHTPYTSYTRATGHGSDCGKNAAEEHA